MAEKPAHILEIPDSLGRDVDAYRAGKLKQAPDVEAFMPDAVKEQVAANTAKAAPIHAEDLTPISGAEAGRRRTFNGETLPSMPATRRVVPAPFRRPSIHIEHHGRSWQSCRAGDVEPGDAVPDIGLVVAVRTEVTRETVAGVPDVATGMKTTLTGAGGIERAFSPEEQVRAHRKA